MDAANYLDKHSLWELVEQNFSNPKALDEWVPHTDHKGRRSFIRAYTPRLIHVLPGNAPRSITQSALVKSVSVFKRASADPSSIACQRCAITWPAAVLNASSISAMRARALLATPTMPCILYIGSFTGWPIRMAAKGND